MMKKIIRIGLYLLILSIPLAGLVYTLPRNIKVHHAGIEYRLGDVEYSSPISVVMEGRIQRRFFEKNRFRGVILLGDHDLGDMDVTLNPDGALLMVRDAETGKLERFGVLYSASDISQLTIAVLEPTVLFGQVSEDKFWDRDSGLMISAPAHSRQDAVNISNELLGNLLEEPLE